MAMLSSPIQYPPSSSPPGQEETKKRPHGHDDAGPKPKKRLFGRSILDSVKPLEPVNGNITRTAEPVGQHDSPDKTVPSTSRPESTPKEPVSQNASSSGTTAPVWVEPPCEESGITALFTPADGSLTTVRTSNGRRFVLQSKQTKSSPSYQQTIAQRSHTEAGKATKSFYGVDIHRLIEEAKEINSRTAEVDTNVQIEPALEVSVEGGKVKKKDRMMWAEKYRAKKFTDLVGDERTHRSVLRWLKSWDATVFPGASKPMVKGVSREEDEKVHRKILLLTGPPGLGKTTLAHVCAKQAGYEVVEINASDDRSKDVVKGRIRDCVGTENVRGLNSKIGDKTVRKAGRPVCVVVDEVDGVVGGSGGSGEGGFMKALVDLVTLDQKNSNRTSASTNYREKKGDSFRLLRPMILICNDVYHPSLRPLRSSNLAEIIHVRKPPLDKVVARLKHVFEKEQVPADVDGVRRLCEATWGISSRRDDRGCSNTGEGDMRAVLVIGEWAAGKLRASARTSASSVRLTRQWLEKHMLSDLTSTSGSSTASRGLGRGGTKEAADRVFLDNAGFPKAATAPNKSTPLTSVSTSGPASATEASRARALELLRDVVDTAGDTDRIVSDIFTTYPTRPFHDDTLLSKPNAAADWLSFHDSLSSRIHGASQTYELAPYLSTSVLACHTLFASAKSSLVQNSTSYNETEDTDIGADTNPFQGPRADYIAYEQQKQTRAILSGLQSSLSIPLARSFRSPEHLSADLVPFLHQMLSPAVTPVLVGGSGGNKTASVRRDVEKDMVNRAVKAMGASGVGLERMRVEDERLGNGGWIYRMEPPIDTLATFETAQKNSETALPARFAVRQILAQEHVKWTAEEESRARQARFEAGNEQSAYKGTARSTSNDKKEQTSKDRKKVIKRDFFGRIIKVEETTGGEDGKASNSESQGVGKAQIWVSYHEGFSNAVRKPISLKEIMAGL